MNQNVHTAFVPQTAMLERSNLRCITAGQGEPVVFLHGVGGFKELWWETMRVMQAQFRMFAFDWPGHGSPPLPTDTPILETLAQQTIEACDELGLRQIALVGHSLGGNVAARVALTRPDLVTRLALIDAAVLDTHLPFYGKLYVDPRWSRYTGRTHASVAGLLGRIGARVPHDHAGGLLQPWARRCYYMMQAEEQILQAFVRAVYQGSLGDDLRHIQQPTLVLTGSRDMLVRPGQARKIAAMIPDARLVIQRGAYHNPMDEQPAAFQRTLRAFLQGSTPTG